MRFGGVTRVKTVAVVTWMSVLILLSNCRLYSQSIKQTVLNRVGLAIYSTSYLSIGGLDSIRIYDLVGVLGALIKELF